jgi:hypothetical protein
MIKRHIPCFNYSPGFQDQFGIPKNISGDAKVKKLIAGSLILTAMIPVALMTGCGSSNSPTSTNATSTPTAITTSTVTATATIVPAGPAALVLGAASSTGAGGNFSILAGTSVTDTSYPTLSGNVGGATNSAYASGTDGLAGASSLFSSTGTSANQYWTIVNDPQGYSIAANVAVFGAGGAYATGVAVTGTPLASTEIGGLSLAPGVYTSTGALTLGSASALNLTLNNAGGNPNNVYIFRTGAASDLTTYAGTSITLVNVKPANVFWVVQRSAYLAGTSSTSVPPVAGFIGTIMASTSITFNANSATLEGHAFCNTGSISFASSNVISYP